MIQNVINDLLAAKTDETAAEAEQLAEKLTSLRQEVVDGVRLTPLPDSEEYNAELERLGTVSWSESPWLFAECYLFRRMHLLFKSSKQFKSYDMFQFTKEDTFYKSASAVSDLAARYQALSEQLTEKELSSDELEVLFKEILLTALWGNATDLSLLGTISLDQIKKLQVSAEHREKDSILVNDIEVAWDKLKTKGGRVDIVLDNAGFEFYTDFVLAIFLLDTGLAEQVVFHPKAQPWFVSDVTLGDWARFVQLLQDDTKFTEKREAIDALVDRVSKYEGQIVFRSSPFWTSFCAFDEIRPDGSHGGAEVWKDLRSTKLVIYKGDLNYRKLTADLNWPRTTPFTEALQSYDHKSIPTLSLRTIKADVVVGLPEGKEEQLNAERAKTRPEEPNSWAWDGSFAVISYAGPK